MIEYTIRDREDGREHKGIAESILIATDGEVRPETPDGYTASGCIYYGCVDHKAHMAMAITKSAMESEEGRPIRTLLMNINHQLNDAEYAKKLMPLLIADAAYFLLEMDEKGKREKKKEDLLREFEDLMRKNGFGTEDD